MSECRVALLAGGKSGEREVSLASAEGAREALEEAGYTVTQLDPADKEDLKRLIDGPFDVAFLCLHGKYGEDGTVQGLLETIGLPYIGSGVWSSALAMDKVKSKLYYEQAGIPTPPLCAAAEGGFLRRGFYRREAGHALCGETRHGRKRTGGVHRRRCCGDRRSN